MTKPLFDVFRSTMLETAEGSRKEAQDAFVAHMKTDPAYFDMLAIDYFERMAATWTVRTETPATAAFVRTGPAQDKIERMSGPRTAPAAALVRRTREESAARTAAAYERMKADLRAVVLLNLVLPNGKALRDATGAECAQAGGFFEAVGRAIKPQQVVDRHLTEADLQNIRARFYQNNEAA
ncbi:hypothetical protein [Ancylobacter radicis]|uniref:Uncharacterized protein n=1 Tax=Ancylobacter radicis TaxID=2836179 RepID=A0ABS5R3G3_9HYPH|nr:hypothetical protein [Ancylobacter radicis]MBS9476190.1 hypothetical protein [Ancylobacter radicis]